MDLETKLTKVKYNCDTDSHLICNQEICKSCNHRVCTTVCPAEVYKWIDEEKKLVVNFENCLECGACRISCPNKNIQWAYPKSGKGVTFKYG